MKYEEIQALLDKYFEGETSLEEERSIKSYFASGQTDDRLRAYLPMFQVIREEQAIQIRQEPRIVHAPGRFAIRYMRVAAAAVLLLAAFAWWQYQPAPTETVQPVASVRTPEAPVPPQPAAVHENEAPKSVATAKVAGKRSGQKHKAVFAHSTARVVNIKKPEEAAAEIKAALELISVKLRKGKKEATKNLDAIENIDKIIKKRADS